MKTLYLIFIQKMPEGPEVRTIVDGLDGELRGATLTGVFFSDGGKYRSKVPPNFKKFKENLPMKITGVRCKGKFIYFGFQKNIDGEKHNFYIGNSLGMTGFWKSEELETSKRDPKHLCMTLVTTEGLFQFIDQRHFGCVHFYTYEEIKAKLATIGPDFLNSKIGEDKFIEIYNKKPRKNIVSALMDQKIVSGIGNYIKSESLYRARISPHRTIGDLSDEELGKLYRAIKKVTKSSYKHGGMSQENYVDIDGNEGEYMMYLQVYRKKKDPKGNEVIREETKDKRSTFWVPNLQN